jgi:hypothetical protein
MKLTPDTPRKTEPLVEPAPDEAVLRALAQSAYPVEFVEANKSEEDAAEPDES